jgi:hypothetical protein
MAQAGRLRDGIGDAEAKYLASLFVHTLLVAAIPAYVPAAQYRPLLTRWFTRHYQLANLVVVCYSQKN